MDEHAQKDLPIGRLDLFYITRAYNQGEITLEEWIRQSRAWAEAVIARQRKPAQLPGKRAGPD